MHAPSRVRRDADIADRSETHLPAIDCDIPGWAPSRRIQLGILQASTLCWRGPESVTAGICSLEDGPKLSPCAVHNSVT